TRAPSVSGRKTLSSTPGGRRGIGADRRVRKTISEVGAMSELLKRLARVPGDRRADFLAQLSAGAVRRGPALVPRQRVGPTPVSLIQRTLWFMDRLAPGTATYNVPTNFMIEGPLDAGALARAFAAVIERHESLRTSIEDSSEGPVQVVKSTVDT